MHSNILKNKKILVAEDSSINQMLIKRTLAMLGASTDIAHDGLQAIEKFKKNQYDLVLMDIQLPGMDGYEATAIIRNELNSNIPVFAMTAFVLDSKDKEYLASGMNGYIVKPFTIASISNTLEKVLTTVVTKTNNSCMIENEHVSIDLNMLEEISGNDEAFIDKMVHTFLAKMPENLEKIEEAIKRADWEKVYQSAHYTKSSLSIIKIADLYDWVLQIEVNAKNKTNLESLPYLFNRIRQKFAYAEALLHEKFPEKYSAS